MSLAIAHSGNGSGPGSAAAASNRGQAAASRGRPPAALGHPRQLSARWLSAMLRSAGLPGEVAGFRWRRIGADTGITGFVTRVELRYRRTPPADVPRTLVVKFPRHLDLLDWAIVERRFYLDHAGSWPIRTPRCYLAAINKRARRWTLVLEDLDGHRSLDDIAGVSIEDAEILVESLAAMHAWGRRPEARLEWLEAPDPTDSWLAEYYDHYAARGVRRLHGFVPRQHLAVFKGLSDVGRAVLETLASEPGTAVHADFRGDNLFMTEAAAPIAVDWENIRRDSGGAELGRFFVTSLRPDDLRRYGNALIARYAAALARRGVTDYPRTVIERDVRLGMVRHMMVAVPQMHEAVLGRGRPLRVVRTWAIRANEAVRHFDALSAVPAA